MILAIKNADLIAADLTDHNPNVFYELALAHAFEKPVVPLVRADQSIPFDNRPMGTVFYSRDRFEGWEQAKAELKHAAEDTQQPGYKASNPVTIALGIGQMKASGDDKDQLLKMADPSLYGGADYKCRAVWCNMCSVGQHACRPRGAAFPMDFDLVLRDVRLADAKPGQPATDIGVKDGRIAAIAPQLGGSAREQVQGGGRLVCSGFVETHIHLDKSCILARCDCETRA